MYFSIFVVFQKQENLINICTTLTLTFNTIDCDELGRYIINLGKL